ncbi:MAG TPA: hypothetical protein VN754_13805 [Candidatus Binataceae bacterium]|nr:hypothetical protein [Candidatus Binataceae bacterium]
METLNVRLPPSSFSTRIAKGGSGAVHPEDFPGVMRLKRWGLLEQLCATGCPPVSHVALVSKTCSVATAYCVSLNGDTLIPANVPINFYERSYIDPGATTGADTNVMVYPNVISAGFE